MHYTIWVSFVIIFSYKLNCDGYKLIWGHKYNMSIIFLISHSTMIFMKSSKYYSVTLYDMGDEQ
jgi:hypothetical protein